MKVNTRSTVFLYLLRFALECVQTLEDQACATALDQGALLLPMTNEWIGRDGLQ